MEEFFLDTKMKDDSLLEHKYADMEIEKQKEMNKLEKKTKKKDIITLIIMSCIISALFVFALSMKVINQTDTYQDKYCNNLSIESESLRERVVIEMYLAGYHNEGKPDIFYNSYDPWYQTTPGWFYQNGVSLMANYLFNNTDNDRIFTDINTEGKARIIGFNLNWDMVQKYPESYYPWSYQFKQHKNLSIELKFLISNTPVFKRWRNIINDIFDWKYRVEKNKSCSIDLPSFENFIKKFDDNYKKQFDI